jgi:hypothetical protein
MNNPTYKSLLGHAPSIAHAITAYRQLDDEGRSIGYPILFVFGIGRARECVYGAEVLIAALLPDA